MAGESWLKKNRAVPSQLKVSLGVFYLTSDNGQGKCHQGLSDEDLNFLHGDNLKSLKKTCVCVFGSLV
jgi:hypothetical protein